MLNDTIVALAHIVAQKDSELASMESRYSASQELMNTYGCRNNRYEEKIERAAKEISMAARQWMNEIGTEVTHRKINVDTRKELFDRGLVRYENVGLSSKQPGIHLTELGKLFIPVDPSGHF
jgi:hypothetical protein